MKKGADRGKEWSARMRSKTGTAVQLGNTGNGGMEKLQIQDINIRLARDPLQHSADRLRQSRIEEYYIKI